MKPLTKWAVFALVCVAVSCGISPGRLNVIIIGIDTLRSDHLGCYGYQKDTSPNIDRLAGGGILFENAISQCPWTLPSFATALTSLYPTQHAAGSPGVSSFGTRMRTSFPPLAMMLLKKGYSTGAVINAPALSSEFGVDRGFEVYDTATYREHRIADEVTEAVLEWVDLNKDGPFLMFAHYFDPHLPYEPPAPYDTLFDHEYRGRICDSFDLSYFPRARITNFETMKVLTPEDWNHIRSLYDGEIAFTDQAIGELLRGLEDRGLRKNTLIVLLSDHGEEFFEHGGFEHGHTVYQEQIHVPLIFALPGAIKEGRRIPRQVRLLDVTPTILDFLGIEPRAHIEGTSLRPLIDGRVGLTRSEASLIPTEFAYSERMLYGHEKKSITAYPWKLIYDTATGGQMLFNIRDDPDETDNLIDQNPEALAPLQEVLFKTLFGISDTWYVEMAGGQETHSFDLEIALDRGPVRPKISLYKIINADGRLAETERIIDPTSDNLTLRIRDLKIQNPLTLAFKVEAKRVSVKFDFRIDGEPALTQTFLGQSLASPANIPFVQKGAPGSPKSKGQPSTRPQPPYFIVWHTESRFRGEQPVELSQDTKKQLRALGYIQ
jgi:arylsulfatase A-like enzyme